MENFVEFENKIPSMSPIKKEFKILMEDKIVISRKSVIINLDNHLYEETNKYLEAIEIFKKRLDYFDYYYYIELIADSSDNGLLTLSYYAKEEAKFKLEDVIVTYISKEIKDYDSFKEFWIEAQDTFLKYLCKKQIAICKEQIRESLEDCGFDDFYIPNKN